MLTKLHPVTAYQIVKTKNKGKKFKGQITLKSFKKIWAPTSVEVTL